MELITFSAAKSDLSLRAAAGTCQDQEQFRSWLNEATEALMRRGNFWGTVQKIRVCVFNQCITWPRYVGTILAVNRCNRYAPVQNNWFSFMPLSRSDFGGSCGFGYRNGCFYGNTTVENDGETSVYSQIPCGENFYVRAYPMTRNDIGKQISLFGLDSNRQPIRTKDSNGVWQDGVSLTLDVPYVSTSFTLSQLDRVIKDETEMPLNLFYYDSTNDVLLQCATYQPTETSPVFRHSRITNWDKRQTSCDGARQVEALVKLAFIPVKSDTDLVLISCMRALKKMIQSVREEEAETDKAPGLEASAIRELNLQLRDIYPVDQIPINIDPFGTYAHPVRHGIGQIV